MYVTNNFGMKLSHILRKVWKWFGKLTHLNTNLWPNIMWKTGNPTLSAANYSSRICYILINEHKNLHHQQNEKHRKTYTVTGTIMGMLADCRDAWLTTRPSWSKPNFDTGSRLSNGGKSRSISPSSSIICSEYAPTLLSLCRSKKHAFSHICNKLCNINLSLTF